MQKLKAKKQNKNGTKFLENTKVILYNQILFTMVLIIKFDPPKDVAGPSTIANLRGTEENIVKMTAVIILKMYKEFKRNI